MDSDVLVYTNDDVVTYGQNIISKKQNLKKVVFL